MSHYWAIVNDPKVGLKLSEIDEGEIEGSCSVCGEKILHKKDLLYPIVQVACKPEHAHEAISILSPARSSENISDTEKPETILDDEKSLVDIPAASIEENEPDPTPEKAIRPLQCPVCSGPRAGRGYSHTAECTESTAYKLAKLSAAKQSMPKQSGECCAECGGLKRGRGFAHADGCSLSSKVLQMKAKTNNLY